MKTPPILKLGPDFFAPVAPATFPAAIPRYWNSSVASELGLGDISPNEREKHFHRFESLSNNLPQPLALRYHGHQFLNYNPELGDGRGFLFAQLQDTKNRWIDLGTKGSGQTPYSRSGDGRLTLKGAYREILATELLESLGVRTSKTLSVFETGESLVRYDEPSPTRSAVLVRACHSHIRFGSFQRLGYIKRPDLIKQLTQYTILHYYPQLAVAYTSADFNHIDLQVNESTVALFFRRVIQKSAELVAQWMMAGFVHGVMNTDNMNINGEAFDFGPYRFLPRYDIRFTAAYFDQQGLYSFGRQPITMLWNLERLGEILELAWPNLPTQELLEEFGDEFNIATQNIFLKRLNLKFKSDIIDEEQQSLLPNLLNSFFVFLEQSKALYEQTFFDLHSNTDRWKTSPQSELYNKSDEFKNILALMDKFDILNPDLIQHSYFQNSKPCTLLIEEIEDIWKPIAEKDDWSLFEKKLEDIRAFRGIY